MEGCALLFLVIIVIAIAVSASQGKARERARLAYLEALARLRNDPANPHLREETLARGRHYSYLTRNRRGVSLFDEVALMNDINAACAAASRPQLPAPAPRASVEDRLRRLAELKEKGLVDDAEYTQRRKEILNDV